MLDVRSGSVLALPPREQAEQRWKAAVAVLAQSMGVRLITHEEPQVRRFGGTRSTTRSQSALK